MKNGLLSPSVSPEGNNYYQQSQLLPDSILHLEPMDPFSTTFDKDSPARLPLSPQVYRANPLSQNSEMISVPDLLLLPLKILKSKDESRSSRDDLHDQAGISEVSQLNRTAVDITL